VNLPLTEGFSVVYCVLERAMSGSLDRLRRAALICASAVALANLAFLPASAADSVTVNIDQAQVIRLPDRAATLVLGNPLIADVSLQKGGILVLTGKSYGATNLLMLDRAGNTVSEKVIQVLAPKDPTVVVFRQMERQTLSCAPQCEPRLTLGDAPTVFTPTLDQIGARNGGAQGAAPAAVAPPPR